MKTPFGKMISMVVLSVLLMTACDKPGTNSAVDQNGAPDENTTNAKGLKGLDSSHLLGKWEALESANALDAKELTISDLLSEPVQPTSTTDAPSTTDVPSDVAQPSNSQIKSAKSNTCLNYPMWCATLCKQYAYGQGCPAFISKCKQQPYSVGCQAYLNKLPKPSGGSQQPVQTEVSVPTMNLKMVIGGSDLKTYIMGVDTANNMIQIQLEEPLQRVDYYLIREVDGVTYFDICPCDAKECTADNAKACSAEFTKKIESGKPGQFKKL